MSDFVNDIDTHRLLSKLIKISLDNNKKLTDICNMLYDSNKILLKEIKKNNSQDVDKK